MVDRKACVICPGSSMGVLYSVCGHDSSRSSQGKEASHIAQIDSGTSERVAGRYFRGDDSLCTF